MNMNGTFNDPTHNCWQCRYSWLGRCMHGVNYGLDISAEEVICLEFTDGRNPSEVTFKTVGQLKNYLRAYFYKKDFVKEFTRKQLVQMLEMLYPLQVKQNTVDRAFKNMCKKRMVAHIEFYIKLHDLKCETN